MAAAATIAGERNRVATAGRLELDSAVVRFAGDSGDGIQLTGAQFTQATALAGNSLETFPDFPAEIRAPVGTTFGVSAFQIHFGARRIWTIGDHPDVLVALNPAALKVSLEDLKPGGIVILDAGSFDERSLKKAGLAADPRFDGTLDPYRVVPVDITAGTRAATKHTGLSVREQLRCKNFYALGLVYWMFERDRAPTVRWLEQRFADRPELAAANIAALDAGHALGETAEIPQLPAFHVEPAPMVPGIYRTVTGHEALAFGLLDGARKAGLEMVFCSYPITPASALLHHLAKLRTFGVTTFQAEDEIAAVCAAIGASYAGSLGVTASSGPGIALKTEAIGLAVATELPLVIVDAQRGGPSTGLPTKTEQSDLYQAVFGRNGDCPIVVLAAATPSDCFAMAREAVRLAVHHMTPVMLLTDGFLANASEPWLIPDLEATPPFPARFRTDPEGFHPYLRDERLVRPWVKPGTPGLEHRIGGIEKDYASGNISYDPVNHQRMTDARWEKVLKVADAIPLQGCEQGAPGAALAVVGWGSTYGPIARAVLNARARGHDVAHVHLRHLWPLPRNLGDLLQSFGRIVVPEMNKGQLVTLLRSEYLVPAKGLSKVTGKPFTIAELEAAIAAELEADRA
ncbi:2-oxoacid:acceptor oxidoreductase subunit alpha [Benzoatithermus flavus]|uniref:2-oxoacid:acceptor oxidoreductase subunit alpha n=1 Tax=Benzoatithermus flavus TaxID=3108223 RepID=A0ABU8XRP6_9PROT